MVQGRLGGLTFSLIERVYKPFLHWTLGPWNTLGPLGTPLKLRVAAPDVIQAQLRGKFDASNGGKLTD